MKYSISIILLSLLFINCKQEQTKLTAQQIIDKSIIYSGTDKVANSEITFKFRDKKYSAKRNKGNFTFTRSFDSITDVLSNNDF